MRKCLPVVVIVLSGCLSAPSENFVDREALPASYLGGSYRAWVQGGKLFVEVDHGQGQGLVSIDCEVREGFVYLKPLQSSSGGPRRDVVSVDSCKGALPPDWPNRLYWLTDEHFYPITSSPYWNRAQRAPSERVRVVLETAQSP
jgi:hypothetical protein